MPAPNFYPLPDLDGYRIIRKLGQQPHGTSIILQSYSDDLRAFAKLIPIDKYSLFEAWQSRTIQIDGPSWPRLIGAGISAGQYVVLRTFVEGESLQAFLLKGRDFQRDDCLALVIQLAERLRQVHAVGLFHGRLKPSNIIITLSLAPCITEIHVPYFRFKELSVTRIGFQVEHPAHLAPEHFDPEAVIDIRTDIFCLGTIAYQMLTGRHPFAGDTSAEIKLNILNLEPSPPSTIPSSISFVIMKMLEKSPDRRYQSPQELLDELEGARSGQVLIRESPVTPKPERRKRPVVRSLYCVAGLFACALLIVVAIIIVSQRDDQPAIAPLDARRRASLRSPASKPQPQQEQQPADIAESMLQSAKELAVDDPKRALDLLEQLIHDHPGTPAAAQAIQAKASLAKSAAIATATEQSKLEERVRDLVAQDKFGEALAFYTQFLDDHRQDRNAAEHAQLAILALKGQAEKRLASLNAEAEGHTAAGRYEKAAMLCQLIRDNFGIEHHVAAAAQHLAALEPLVKAEREKRFAEQQSAQQRAFLQMILPAEQKARLWQFAEAAKACEALSAATKDEHTLMQLADQKREYELLARLKNTLVDKITATAPIPLSVLRASRPEGEIVAADIRGLVTKVGAARAQERWDFLPAEMVEALVARSVRANDAEDHAAAALLFLRLGLKASAQREFDLAERLKGDVQVVRHSAPSELRNLDNDEKAAEELIARAQNDMLRKQWTDALASLEALIRRHPGTYALQTRKSDVDQWLGTCRTSSKAELFDRSLRQGIAVDLLTAPPDGQWTTSGGTWSIVEGGVLRCDNDGKQDVDRSIVIRYPPQYLLRSELRAVSGPGLLVRVVAAQPLACDFTFDVENPKNVGLLIVQNGNVTRTIVKEVKLERGRWYDFRAAVRPGAITVHCAGARFAVTDFPSLRGSQQVTLSLMVRQGSVAEFRDVVLQTLKRQ